MTLEAFISSLTFDEELRAYELLWQEISKEPESIPSPDWHAKVLVERTANPINAPRNPLKEAIQMVREQLDADRTSG